MTMTPFKSVKRLSSVADDDSADMDDVSLNDMSTTTTTGNDGGFGSALFPSEPSSSMLIPNKKHNDIGRHSPGGIGVSSASTKVVAHRLFATDADFSDEGSKLPPSPPSRVLKPLDLNLDLAIEEHGSGMPTTTAASHFRKGEVRIEGRRRLPSPKPPPRKRHAESQIMVGRSLSFEEDVDEDASNSHYVMMSCSSASPGSSHRMSPPANQMMSLASKSPSSFRTIDGRMVQSKNPFSPMLTDETTPVAEGELSPTVVDSLTFPVSLEDNCKKANQNRNKKNYGKGGVKNCNTIDLPRVATPLLRHRLHKRESPFDSPNSPAKSCHFDSVTQDGYPHRDGRYSFTGSPIPETTMEHDARDTAPMTTSTHSHQHKLRRLSKGDDVVTASYYGSCSANGKPVIGNVSWKQDMHVDTYSSNYNVIKHGDGISPTDVFSFPLMSSPGKAATNSMPRTPFKKESKEPLSPSRNTNFYYNQTRNISGSRTPVKRSAAAAPPTPMPDRRRTSTDSLESCHVGDGSSSRTKEQQGSVGRFHSDFDVIGELGKGSFGKVYKVLSRLDGCMYAVKTAHRPAKGNADKDRMLKEVYALAALSDQADTATFHIVRYHQAWMEENRLYIQTELCTSTLADQMRKRNKDGTLVMAAENRRYKFLREILLALEFIHRHEMVHLDIKPENIFLKNDQFKLGDFGLVSKISYHQDVEEGDSRYMSMELLSGQHEDLTKSDIFSLGISMYEICISCNDDNSDTKTLPTNGPEWQALRACEISMPDHRVPKAMQLIIRQMMNPSAAARPAASDLLKRPQLLSEEQKALLAAKNKVIEANLALVAQEHKLRLLSPKPLSSIPRKALVRASTWNGS